MQARGEDLVLVFISRGSDGGLLLVCLGKRNLPIVFILIQSADVAGLTQAFNKFVCSSHQIGIKVGDYV